MWWSRLAFAGLGPHQVAVLYNADDPGSVGVAEAYATARSLPAGHLCGLPGIDPAASQIDFDTFRTTVLEPFEACRDALPDPDEITVLVTVRGLPLVVTLPEYVVGLEAALQVGRGTQSGTEIAGIGQLTGTGFSQASIPNPAYVDGFCSTDLVLTNPYQDWYTSMCGLQSADELPDAFDRGAPWTSGAVDLTGELYIVTRLDGFDYADAEGLVDQARAAEGTLPVAPILCMESADLARAARDPECELTVRRLTEAGVPATWVSPHDPLLAGVEVSAYFTGADNLRDAIDGVTFVPGAVVDNLTSYGAVPQNFVCDAAGVVCPASESQTSIARFVRAGATAVHGTVAEPLNNVFPNAGALALYSSGYTVGESFLYTQRFLYWQNVLLGDPLVAAFAERPEVTVGPEVGAGGTLVVTATHPAGIGELALFVDGARVATERLDRIEWMVDAEEGDTLEVLAVASAAASRLQRPGWPATEQKNRSGTQGWSALTLTVGPPDGTSDPADDDDPTGDAGPKEGGCGCAGGAPGATAGATLLAALAGRRRRAAPAART
jgi:uncharacterized protein (TIGR03790 family)